MKLGKIIVKNGDIPGAIKNAVINRALAYGKTYELLHKQIWRKDPNRLLLFHNPLYPTYNGRPVAFIRRWNIKSWSPYPYRYDGTHEEMGLNQLFVGQDPRKWYQGNPKDGIYHDECYIEPRHINATNEGYFDCWGYYDGSDGDGYPIITQTWDKQDSKGDIINSNVSYERYTKTTTTTSTDAQGNVTTTSTETHHRRITITHPILAPTVIELGEYDPTLWLDEGIIVGKSDYTHYAFGYRKWKKPVDEMAGHGTVLFEQSTTPTFSLQEKTFVSGWIRVYSDGTAIEYTPESMERYNDDDGFIIPSHYTILPMMYTDTGDLTMDRKEFVERWNDYFELFVYENSEWWQALIKPIAAIVTVIIAFNTGYWLGWGLAGTAVFAGGVISAIGILSDNQNMMLFGGALAALGGITAGLQTLMSETATTTLENQLALKGVEEVFKEGTQFSALFQGYGGAAGMENLLTIPTTTSSLELVNAYTNAALQESLSSFIVAESASVFPLLDAYGLNTFGLQEMFSLGKDAFGLVNNLSNISSTPAQQSTTSSTTTETTKVSVLYDEAITDPHDLMLGVIDIL